MEIVKNVKNIMGFQMVYPSANANMVFSLNFFIEKIMKWFKR